MAKRGKVRYTAVYLGILLLTLLPLVSSITLKTPTIENHLLNSDFTFVIQPYNSTGLILDNTTTNCTIQLYSSVGSLLVNSPMVFDSPDYELNVLAGNFTTTGQYSTSFYCNTLTLGGFSEVSFKVTPTGTELEVSESLIYVSLLAVLFFMLALSSMIMGRLPRKNNRDEETGRIISINRFRYLRTVFIGLIYLFVWAIIHISGNLALNYVYMTGIGNLLSSISYIMGWATLPLSLLLLFKLFEDMYHDSKINDMLSRGIDLD